MNKYLNAILTLLFSVFVSSSLFAGGTVRTNPPSECSAPNTKCNCPQEGVSANCIKVNIGLGETTPWTGSLGCSLKIFADDDSPSVFTPESLHAVLGGYTFKRLGQKTMADGVTPAEVVLSHPNGEAVHFVFANGESLGRPDPGIHIKMDARLQMVDAEGWATTHDPVYYDLYVGDGTKRRFLATNMTGALGALVSITDERGVVRTPADMGVDIIYDPDGVRQYLTPTRLANVTRTADFLGYDVAVYALQEPPRKNTATGLYIVPEGQTVEYVSVRRENGGKRAVVTIRKGGGDPLRYVFDYAMGDWSLTRSSGVEEVKSRNIYDSRAAQTVTEVLSSSRTMLGRTECNYKWMSWGFAMTNRVEGFDGVTDTTTWTYYTSGNGKGQVKTEKRQSGLLIQYTYDSLDRLVSETRTGPDMMTEVTTYDYTPVDPSDPVLPVDTRPRTIVRKLNNIECERTYYVYSPLTNIVERVGTQGAAYGSTNVLRTVTTYYPLMVGASLRDARSGFVASVRHEDGKLDLYDYELSSNLWVRTVTHIHEQSPSPVSGKTTRDITLTNARGETTETRTEAFIGGIWYTIARNRMTYNSEGKRTSLENLAGQVTTTAWNCCHKVSEVQPDGATTTWDYDDEGRMIAASRLIPLDMTNVTWLTTCYEYDDLGRQVATWQTNYAAQVGLPATRTRYDALVRVIARVDQLGNTTSTSYSPDGRTVSVLNPNTSTVVHFRSAYGDTLSITGTVVTPEFHTYGILADGTRWSCVVQGETANSPRFTKRYENLLGQIIREERSGFQGAILATTHAYDSLGRLIFSSADYEPAIEYTYDTLGNCIATTRLVGASVPARPPEWRKTETPSSFVLDDSIVWLTQTNIVSCSDSAIAPLITSSARQLTGLTSAIPARSRSSDVRGNVTTNEMLVDAAIVTSRQTVPYATNKPLAISRYGASLMEVSVSAVTNTVAYDALGRQIAHTDGRGNTHHVEYNSLGQRSVSIDALGNRTAFAYDQFGNLASVTDPLGNATVYAYDLRGRKTYEGGATYPVRYTYDIFGNKTTMTTYRNAGGPTTVSAAGDVTTWLYDVASGSMTNKVYADGKGPFYAYTPNGKLSQRTWARGIVTDYFYDNWGSLTNTVYSDGTPTVSLFYDALGRQVEAHDAAGTTTFLYDAFGSLTNENIIGVSGINTIERHWDNYGRTAGYSLCGTESLCEVDYEYDDLAHFAAVEFDSHTELQSLRVEYAYLPGTDIVSSYTSGDFSRSVSYEHQRDLIVAVTNTFGASLISAFSYENDAVGRRVSRLDFFGGEVTANTFVYDTRSEVMSAIMGTNTYGYAYDPIGNRVESSQNLTTNLYSANCLNQYTSIPNLSASVPLCESSLTYDTDGNTTADDRFAYFWNGESRMVCASNDEVVVSYAYDYRGRMVRKIISHGGTEAYVIAYIWDNWSIIREIVREGDSATVTDNVWGLDIGSTLQGAGGVGGLLAVFRDSTVFLPTYDANGNITEYISTKGAVAVHYAYSPFGEQLIASSPVADAFTHQFSTKPWCCVTALAEYQLRKYRPALGRWTSRDPIEEDGGANVYAYVGNQVFAYVDLFGLQQQNVPCAGICGAIIDDWILAELAAQFAGWSAWKEKNSTDWLGRPKTITIEDYLKWANGNQRYKDPKFFEFNKGVYPKCGTEDSSKSSVGCGRSVTLCGKCVRSAILGNIMYGIVGRHAGFTAQELKDGATNTKKKWGLRVDKYDEAAYDVGSGMFEKWSTGISIQDFCTEFNSLVQNSPDALREGNRSGGYNDLTTCQPCQEKSKEARHGGSESPRRRP